VPRRDQRQGQGHRCRAETARPGQELGDHESLLRLPAVLQPGTGGAQQVKPGLSSGRVPRGLQLRSGSHQRRFRVPARTALPQWPGLRDEGRSRQGGNGIPAGAEQQSGRCAGGLPVPGGHIRAPQAEGQGSRVLYGRPAAFPGVEGAQATLPGTGRQGALPRAPCESRDAQGAATRRGGGPRSATRGGGSPRRRLPPRGPREPPATAPREVAKPAAPVAQPPRQVIGSPTNPWCRFCPEAVPPQDPGTSKPQAVPKAAP
jgi:hypothetical protein